MATWKYSSKEVSAEDLDKALKGAREACFRCGKEMHSDDCSIYKLVVEIQALKGSERE